MNKNPKTPDVTSTRQYRVVLGTEDEDEFWRCRGVALSNERAMPHRIVHVNKINSLPPMYGRRVLSVSAYATEAELKNRLHGRMTLQEWLQEQLEKQDRQDRIEAEQAAYYASIGQAD